MRPTLLLVLIASALTAADTPVVTCKPVMITAGAELPATIGFHERPMGYELGVKISYLVEGEDLIGFKDDSLIITAITTADGKNIANKRNGKPAWKQGSFPKTTDDGKFGIFSIDVSENVFGNTDGLSVTGTIVVLSGSDHQTKKATFKLSEAKTEDIGGLKVSLKKGKEEAGAAVKSFFGVVVAGDITKVDEVMVLEGTTQLDSRGSSSWSGAERTYNFAKPAGDSVTVEITYWNKLAVVTVPIGKK